MTNSSFVLPNTINITANNTEIVVQYTSVEKHDKQTIMCIDTLLIICKNTIFNDSANSFLYL